MAAVFLPINAKIKELMDTNKSIAVRGTISPSRVERRTYAFENYLIRFFERELEVKLTRREMWRSVRFVASLFVLLLALSTGEPLLVLPALALAAYAYRDVADITSRFTEKGGAR